MYKINKIRFSFFIIAIVLLTVYFSFKSVEYFKKVFINTEKQNIENKKEHKIMLGNMSESNIEKVDHSESDFKDQNHNGNNEGTTEYVNQHYRYKISFPNKWYLDKSLSEHDLREQLVDNDFKVQLGGQTFWSNYRNMQEYSPDNKPDDFHILALTVYRVGDIDEIEEFAKKINFDYSSDKVEFSAQNSIGKEFILPGIDKDNPNVAIIFKENGFFYVFRLAFIGGRVEVAEEMENIVKSFKVF